MKLQVIQTLKVLVVLTEHLFDKFVLCISIIGKFFIFQSLESLPLTYRVFLSIRRYGHDSHSFSPMHSCFVQSRSPESELFSVTAERNQGRNQADAEKEKEIREVDLLTRKREKLKKREISKRRRKRE